MTTTASEGRPSIGARATHNALRENADKPSATNNAEAGDAAGSWEVTTVSQAKNANFLGITEAA